LWSVSRRFLGEGDVGRVVLRASEPVCIEAYKDVAQLGRFVIIGRTGTVAAGIIMDVLKMEGYVRKIRYIVKGNLLVGVLPSLCQIV